MRTLQIVHGGVYAKIIIFVRMAMVREMYAVVSGQVAGITITDIRNIYTQINDIFIHKAYCAQFGVHR